MKLSEKLKEYRKRAGMNQLDLEVAIGASPGSISRIESGKVNPTKETVKAITEALNLNPLEKSYFLDISVDEFTFIGKIINKISIFSDQQDFLQRYANIISNETGYTSLAIFTLDSHHNLRLECVSQNRLAVEVNKILPVSYRSIYINEKINKNNYLLRAAMDSEILQSRSFIQFGIGTVPNPLLRIIAKAMNFKKGIVLPMIDKEGNSIGCVFFSKANWNESLIETPMLKVLVKQITIMYQQLNKDLH